MTTVADSVSGGAAGPAQGSRAQRQISAEGRREWRETVGPLSAQSEPVGAVVPIDLDQPDVLAEVLRLQRAAYAVEAALIGDDRIPALHEDAGRLHAAGLRWLAVSSGERLAGALAWLREGDVVDLHRLVVDPAQLRRGIGRALVQHLLAEHGDSPVVVSTGRDNSPARRLYESLGFTESGQAEVVPGLWVVRYSLSR